MNQQRPFDVLLYNESIELYLWLRLESRLLHGHLFILLGRLGYCVTRLLRFGVLFFKRFNLLALAVLLDESVQCVQISEDVDATAPIQMRRLKDPQIVAVKVAQRQCVLLLLLVKVKRSRLCPIFEVFRLLRRVSISSDKHLIQFAHHLLATQVLTHTLSHSLQKALLHLLELGSMALKRLPKLSEALHGILIHLSVGGVGHLDIEGNWHNFEHILFLLVAVPLQHVQQVVLLSQEAVVLKMIGELLVSLLQ